MNKIRYVLFITLALLLQSCGTDASAPVEANINSKYLVIMGTEKQEISVVNKYQELNKKVAGIRLVSTNDCDNLKPNLVLFVSDITENQDLAQKSLEKARDVVPDSYLRECKLKTPSRFQLNLPMIHKSILSLDEEELYNWSYSDAESVLFTLNKPELLFVEKTFDQDLNDIGDGRKSTVLFIKGTENKLVVDQCWDFKLTDQQEEMLVFQCMTSMAADNYIFTTYVFNKKQNKVVFAQEYCQNGKLDAGATLACDEQKIDEFGSVTLVEKRFSLP